MKKFLAILVVALLATSFAFADVNDKSTTTKEGSGTFTCTVLTALSVTTTAPSGSMGIFVVADDEYEPTEENVITFDISGDETNGAFYYKLCSVTESDQADITIDWGTATAQDFPVDGATWTAATLVGGVFKIEGTVTFIKAKASGQANFNQSLTVSYNNI